LFDLYGDLDDQYRYTGPLIAPCLEFLEVEPVTHHDGELRTFLYWIVDTVSPSQLHSLHVSGIAITESNLKALTSLLNWAGLQLLELSLLFSDNLIGGELFLTVSNTVIEIYQVV
jgi:hypothetical protein